MHHAGPFDAAAKSRNTNNAVGPMAVFSGPDPHSQAAVQAVLENKVLPNQAEGLSNSHLTHPPPPANHALLVPGQPLPQTSNHPVAAMAQAPGTGDAFDEGQRTPRATDEAKTNPLLEIWGRQEAEPYEDFSMGGAASGAGSRASSIWEQPVSSTSLQRSLITHLWH